MLNCENPDPDMGDDALAQWQAELEDLLEDVEDLGSVTAHYEHGQWWITTQSGAAWSVNDLGREDDDPDNPPVRFCFEQVSEPDPAW